MQARKYQRLVKDTEEIGDEVQNLARFAAVQKTAFRKILKKYRKWTGSTSLQHRVQVEIFSSEKLKTDYSDYLQALSQISTILTQELAAPMLTGKKQDSPADRVKRSSQTAKRSSVAQINEASLRGPLAFDAAILAIPYGEAAGSAFYWVHPDNLDETRTLLLRHMRDASAPNTPSRINSTESMTIRRKSSVPSAAGDLLRTDLFDNVQRFIKDTSSTRPSRIALRVHWNDEAEAVVTMSGLSHASQDETTLSIKSKDLPQAFQRELSPSKFATGVNSTRKYLAEHRDVKPLAEIASNRARFFGTTNSADIGVWATLDTSITVTDVDIGSLGDAGRTSQAGEAFPYGVLHVRWEFIRRPAVVRAFDDSHLVEKVTGFTLEDMAIHTMYKGLAKQAWHATLDKDIRKVPLVPRKGRATKSRAMLNSTDVSSAPSSTGADSVFSSRPGQSSSVSDDVGVAATPPQSKSGADDNRRKKKARIILPEPGSTTKRYWNEFDDGDSDVNPQEGYVIYIDPNEPAFPGAEKFAKAFEAMYDSLSKGRSRVISWLPLNVSAHSQRSERAPLLGSQSGTEGDVESSGSDSEEFAIPHPMPRSHKRTTSSDLRPKRRSHTMLTPRQKALERTLFYFYTGLLAISSVFLLISGILLGTGRRKAFVEVDVGVIAGVIAAEACSFAAIVLIFMRRQKLSTLHWGLVGVGVATSITIGVAILALMFAGVRTTVDHKNSLY
jgi:SPX domain protein involved in polyphosphate accumulation